MIKTATAILCKLTSIFVLLFCLRVEVSYGQSSLLEYFNVADDTETTARNVATGLSGTNLSLSAGSISTGEAQASSWTRPLPYANGSSGWGQDNSGDAKNFNFTINRDGADSFTLTELSFEERATSSGPSAITVTINGVEVFNDDVPDSDTRLHTIDLTSGFGTDFEDITEAVVLIKGWDNESRTTSGRGAFRVNGIIVQGTVELPDDPLIDRSPSSLSGFAYGEGQGPSSEQSFTIEGTNLEDDITVVPPANYEISESSGSGFTGSNIMITESDGSVAETTIFVRLTAGLAQGDYNENITLSSTGADDVTVDLSGSVVEPFVIPFFNSLRTEVDFDLADAQGFDFVDASLSTTAGGRIDIDTNGFIESPEIDFTQFDKIRTTFDLRNFGGGSNRELTVKVSIDGGSNFTDVQVIPVDIPEDPYETFNVDIDVTGNSSVSNGIIRFEKTDGTGGIRFRDLAMNEIIQPSVEISEPEGWRLLSSPVVDASFQDLLQGSIFTQCIEGADFTGGPCDTNPEAGPNIFTWNETEAEYDSPSSVDNIIGAANGFAVFVYEDDDPTQPGVTGGFPKTVSVVGSEPNSVEVNLSYTESVDEELRGWNLIGNPFGDTIFPSRFDFGSNDDLNNNVYVWDPEIGNYDALSAKFFDIDKEIPAFTGFWVKTDAVNQSFDIEQIAKDPVQRKAGRSPQVNQSFDIEQIAKDKDTPKQQLKDPSQFIVNMTVDDRSSDLILRFEDGGSYDFIQRDAYKLTPLTERHAYIYTEKDSRPLSRGHFPKVLENGMLTVPLHIAHTFIGNATISAQNYNLPEGWEIELINNKTGATWNLLTEPVEINLEETVIFKTAVDEQITFDRPHLAKTGEEAETIYSLQITDTNAGLGDENPQLPSEVALNQNYPNPFNPATTISYELPQSAEVNLAVYDMLGRQVATLVNENVQAGAHQVTFDASNLSSGVYVYRLEAGATVLTRKLTVVK